MIASYSSLTCFSVLCALLRLVRSMVGAYLFKNELVYLFGVAQWVVSEAIETAKLV